MVGSSWYLFYFGTHLLYREFDLSRLIAAWYSNSNSSIFIFSPTKCLPFFINSYRVVISTFDMFDLQITHQSWQLDVRQHLSRKAQTKLTTFIWPHWIEIALFWNQMSMFTSTSYLTYVNIKTYRLGRRQEPRCFETQLTLVICTHDAYLCELLGCRIYLVDSICASVCLSTCYGFLFKLIRVNLLNFDW